MLRLKQCLYSIIYQYNGYGLKRRKLLYQEENVVQEQQKPQATKGWKSDIFFFFVLFLDFNSLHFRDDDDSLSLG